MKVCELCGRQVDETYPVYLEGSKVEVCYDCLIRHNLKPINIKPVVRKANIETYKDNEDSEYMVENYGEIIRSARDRLGLTQEEAAKKLGISLIKYKQIEHEKIVPDKELINKIEKMFNVSLLSKEDMEDEEEDIIAPTNSDRVVLGDIVEIKKKRK